MVVSHRRDALHDGLTALLAGSDPSRIAALPPADAARELQQAATAGRELVARMRFEGAIRNRLLDIRHSDLRGPA